MSALEITTSSAGAWTRFASAALRVVETVTGLGKAVVNRREVNRLAELSDHHLADLGLMRTDLEVVMRGPVASDPTSGLAMLSRERVRSQMRALRRS